MEFPPNELTKLALRPSRIVYRACTDADIANLKRRARLKADIILNPAVTPKDHVEGGFDRNFLSPYISVSTDPFWVLYYIACRYHYTGEWRNFVVIKTPSKLIDVDHNFSRTASELLAHGTLKVINYVAIPFDTKLYYLYGSMRHTLIRVRKSMEGRSYNEWHCCLVSDEKAHDRLIKFVKQTKSRLKMLDFTTVPGGHHFPFRRNTTILPDQSITSHLIPMLNLIPSVNPPPPKPDGELDDIVFDFSKISVSDQ